jgi:hypothetical protein
MSKILVLYYSAYGHVEKMAEAVAEGARAVPGTEVTIKRVPELVPGITDTWQGPQYGYVPRMTRHFSVAPESPICQSGY